MAEITLRGMTWDHARGFDPMAATSAAYGKAHPGVTISWERRSLQAFADRPISGMAETYDLMVIDHPHVGEVAKQGNLMPLDGLVDAEMAALAAGSVGLSHPSYNFAGRQWALAIDTATPVAAMRPDRLEAAPKVWSEVLTLARQGRVGFALIPINALMTFFGLARNLGYDIAEAPDRLMPENEAAHVLDLMREVVALMDKRCLTLDPIGIYEPDGRSEDGPQYSPFGYGYTNYSRAGFCPYPADLPRCAGRQAAGPDRHRPWRHRHRGFGFHQASRDCRRLRLLDRRGGVPESLVHRKRRPACARGSVGG